MPTHRSLTAISSLLFALGLCACSETQDNTYPSFAAAIDAGAVSRGWVPEWLPQNTGKIFEVHNLDTNHFMVHFLFTQHTNPSLPTSCKSVAPTTPPPPPFSRKWWPADVPASGYATHRHAYFQCESEYVAVSPALGEGYVWSAK